MSFAADHVAGDYLFEIIMTVWSTFASPLIGGLLPRPLCAMEHRTGRYFTK